jgi:hypothetical protein
MLKKQNVYPIPSPRRHDIRGGSIGGEARWRIVASPSIARISQLMTLQHGQERKSDIDTRR